MKDVVCWCCEYFDFYENLEIFNGKFVNGNCKYTNSPCLSDNSVCKEFILRSGLFTKRKIPDICKNYRDGIHIDNKK